MKRRQPRERKTDRYSSFHLCEFVIKTVQINQHQQESSDIFCGCERLILQQAADIGC